MPIPQTGPSGRYNDDTIAAWLPAQDQSVYRPSRLRVPSPNPPTYFAVSFWMRDGYSVKAGVTNNTLVAGP